MIAYRSLQIRILFLFKKTFYNQAHHNLKQLAKGVILKSPLCSELEKPAPSEVIKFENTYKTKDSGGICCIACWQYSKH